MIKSKPFSLYAVQFKLFRLFLFDSCNQDWAMSISETSRCVCVFELRCPFDDGVSLALILSGQFLLPVVPISLLRYLLTWLVLHTNIVLVSPQFLNRAKSLQRKLFLICCYEIGRRDGKIYSEHISDKIEWPVFIQSYHVLIPLDFSQLEKYEFLSLFFLLLLHILPW